MKSFRSSAHGWFGVRRRRLFQLAGGHLTMGNTLASILSVRSRGTNPNKSKLANSMA